MISVYILGAGILYGNGEKIFYDHFRKAWLGEEQPLLGEGFNYIPTIHVVDIARMIKKIIFDSVEPGYILAVDRGQSTLKDILLSISGNREEMISMIDILDVYEKEWTDFLNINLKMRTSDKFDKNFQWHCEEGICKNIKKVRDEFVRYRGLLAIKVGIIGAPLSKKSTIA